MDLFWFEDMLTERLAKLHGRTSGIRDMFNLAEDLRENHGKNPVDLSVGNPHLKPPREFIFAMRTLLDRSEEHPDNLFGYTKNPGLPETRECVAKDMIDKFGMYIPQDHVFMTAGAANAILVTLLTLFEPGERNETIILSPYFPEYPNFITEAGGESGVPVVVKSDHDFLPDIGEIEAAITQNTRAIIINSPNNPTGVIIPEERLQALAELLKSKSRELGRPIPCIEDNPYDLIVFGDAGVPSIMNNYQHSFHINSFSKSMSIAGMRSGYLVAHPYFLEEHEDRDKVLSGFEHALRVLQVCAPIIPQRVIAEIGTQVTADVHQYETRVKKLGGCLSQLGFEFPNPQGAFYVLARLPGLFGGELAFRGVAHEGNEPLIYSAGRAFGADHNYIRFSACVSAANIDRACRRLEEICA